MQGLLRYCGGHRAQPWQGRGGGGFTRSQGALSEVAFEGAAVGC